VSTVTATRILKGQQQGHLGPETQLAMDRFPHMALSKVSLETLESPQWVARAGIWQESGSREESRIPGKDKL
jgi:hypothetical protein